MLWPVMMPATPDPLSRETRLARSRAQEARERVIGALQEHFAHDALDVGEFERRVTLARTSESQEPPGLAVETEGVAVMGSFEHVDRAPAHPDPGAPLLRVRGLAFMSSVEIKMRMPGETERDAHRRLKQERRDRKALPGR